MSRLRSLLNPRNLTIILIVIMAAVLLVTIINSQDSAPHQDGKAEKGGNSAKVAVSVLPGGSGSADNLLPLGKSIGSYIDKNDPGSSIYLENLTDKHAVRVGATESFDIKSLMKVPLVMSLYKAVENGSLSLDDEITLEQSEIDQSFGSLWKKGAGYKLTLDEAAKLSLQQSDNTAIHALNDHVFKVMDPSERAYRKVNIDVHVDEKGDSYVSTENYSKIFRCLYDACYNDRQNSDAILELLKHTNFNAPNRQLPPIVEVAHKIGTNGERGNNDCGIVFSEKSPFIFCIMLTATQPQADKDVSEIIKRTYDFMEK